MNTCRTRLITLRVICWACWTLNREVWLSKWPVVYGKLRRLSSTLHSAESVGGIEFDRKTSTELLVDVVPEKYGTWNPLLRGYAYQFSTTVVSMPPTSRTDDHRRGRRRQPPHYAASTIDVSICRTPPATSTIVQTSRFNVQHAQQITRSVIKRVLQVFTNTNLLTWPLWLYV